MTIAYSINGLAEIHGVQSSWQRQPARANTDGTIDFSDWAINVWNISTIGLTNWETLRAAQGALLTTLETNDIDLRNSSGQYDTAFLEKLTSGAHQALQMLNVVATFRVDVISQLDRLLLESGDILLLEDGGEMILENG